MNQASFLFKNQLITAFFCFLIAITTTILAKTDALEQPPIFTSSQLAPLENPCKVIIVIPAHNEANRITPTLNAYLEYFGQRTDVTANFIVVCNNCSDETAAICKKIQKNHPELLVMDLKPGGKGFAIKQGFFKALEHEDADFIGFVDADMATTPLYFYELMLNAQGHDGAIASRYKKGARMWPTTTSLKRIGGRLYNWVLRTAFGFEFVDTQCGAKIFTHDTIKKATPHMQENGWACDLEYLYLCKIFDKNIIEVPTTWVDVPGSHLAVSSCYKEFISSPARIKRQHRELVKQRSQEKAESKKRAAQSKKQSAAL